VNLLSTRRLAEKFLDSDDNPDDETKIVSRYSPHVLSWNQGKFQKTCPTSVSGLPELLFDEGFESFESYCLEVGSPFPTYSSFDTAVVSYEEDNIYCDTMLFILNEAILFKDGQGSTTEAS